MKSITKGILRTLILTGIVAAAGAAAQAQVAFAVRVGPAAVYDNYVPACPGEGYVWTPAYYAGNGWVPGRWIYRGGYAYRGGYDRDRGYAYGDRDRRYGDQDRGRSYAFADRDHRSGDHDRDTGNRGWDHGRR